MKRQRACRGGYVLISVLSVLALLSGLVAVLLLLTRNAVDTAAISSNDLSADAMMQSATFLAGYQLFVLKLPADRVNGQQIRLDQGVLSITVTSDAGKVDLNGSGKVLLAAAYQAAGLTDMTPQAFAARVIDWRDGDSDVTDAGAEAQDYSAAGLDYGPRNGAFRTIDDLKWVLGVTARDMSSLRPFITIFNAGGRLNAFATSSALLKALPGIDTDIADSVLALQGVSNTANIAKLDDLLLVQSALIDTLPPRTYRIQIGIALKDGKQRRPFNLVMASSVNAEQPFQILDHFD